MKALQAVVLLALAVVGQAGAAEKTLLEDLSRDLVSVKGEKLARADEAAVQSAKYVVLYFSAHWCPPCRTFTPKLVEFYNTNKAKYPQFELVFISSDQSDKDMKEYMVGDKMPWFAVDFDKIDKKEKVASYAGSGIPDLVVVEAATGKVLSDSFVGGSYRGPTVVLKELEDLLKKDSAQ